MKRTLLYLAALLSVMAVSCGKEKIDPLKPSIAWEANSSFGTVELTSELNAVIAVNAPGQFQDLRLVMDLGNYNLLANPYIDISSNKGGSNSPVMDLMTDASSIAFLRGLGMNVGTALKGKESVNLDLRAILDAILKGQPVENNTSFSITVRVKDEAGNEASKVARFHFTAAPSFKWVKNPTFEEVDLDAAEMDCKVEVWAPGKIDKLTITLNAAAAPFLKNYVKNRTTQDPATDVLVIDLVNDEKVADSFKDWFPAGSAVSGKEQAVLNFGFLYNIKYDLEASSNAFTISAVDVNGKATSQQVRFKKN